MADAASARIGWVVAGSLAGGLLAAVLVRARGQLRSRSRRWLLHPVLAVLALAAVGGGYETVREAAEARAHPAPGQLIDVGGHRLHLSCTGSGSPTVVLEPGAGMTSSDLGLITPAVAGETRVCVYDRAGRGWSEPADTPQDGAQIATDLHTLLHRAGVPEPYLLAGHSFGGLYVLTFAARYPDEVTGLVLIDSTAPKPPASTAPASAAEKGSYDASGRLSTLVSTVAGLGLGRLYGQVAEGGLPPRSTGEVRASVATASNLRSTIDEYVQASSSVHHAGALTDFGAKPLVVLTAGVGSDATHTAAQNRLATLSSNSVHRTIAGASHEALIGDKKYAAATTQAILDVVTAVRSHRPLA